MLSRSEKCLKPNRRRGVAGLWGIVCLILATAVAATLGRLVLTGNRLVLQEQRRSQCDWLVQAGRSLATSRVRHDAKYSGETWNISAEQLGGSDAGEIVIEMPAEVPAADGSERQVRIIARFPKDSSKQVQVTKTFPLAGMRRTE
jgi:hypothetical protein